MLEFEPTFYLTAINLIVLYLILKRLLFKPVTNFMEKRVARIKQSLKDAEGKNKEAANLKDIYETKLKSIDEEYRQIIKEAKQKAEEEYKRILKKAEKDSECLKLKAKHDIEKEKAKMFSDAKKQIAFLAISVATKVIQTNMDTENNRVLVNKFIEEEGVR